MRIHNINLRSKVNEKLFHLAIGNFDGVHIGHQKIIKKLVSDASQDNKSSAVLSFNPHPRQFFSKNLDRYQIIGLEKKQQLLKDLGVTDLFSLHFDQSIANLSPSDFIDKIIVQKLQVKKLVVGYDFRFGKNREGDALLLRDHASIHGFSLEIIEPIQNDFNQEVYSSTAIREAIRVGDVKKAKSILGYSWTMEGEVVPGDKMARGMGFPTANISPHEQIYPLKGVYVVQILLNDKMIKGIANFGERPTSDGTKLLLEAHLFDFDEDIYGKQLTVEFLTFIREEKKFDNFALLAEQIKKDIRVAKDYHLKKTNGI
jgi:riboflavin kinase/FMN adenylyltransferase